MKKKTLFTLTLWMLNSLNLYGSGMDNESFKEESWVYEFITEKAVEQALEDEASQWGLACVGGALKGVISGGIAQRINHQLNRFVKEVLVHQGLWPANSTPEQDKALYLYWATWFDAIGGTSTGSLLSASWTALKKDRTPLVPQTTETVLDFYLREADENNPRPIFDLNKSWFWGWFDTKYDPQNLENLLDEYFGESTHADTLFGIPLFIVAYNLTQSQLVVFGDGYKPQTRVKDSARASSAVPVLFPGKEIDGDIHADGAFGMNDPTLKLIGFFIKNKKKDQKCVLVTLGTGDCKKDLSFLGQLNYASSLYQIKQLAISLAYGITDGPQDATDLLVQDMTQSPEWDAIPIHPELGRSITPDDPREIYPMMRMLKDTFVGLDAYNTNAQALPASKMVFKHPKIQELYDRLKGRCLLRLARLIRFFQTSPDSLNLSQASILSKGSAVERFAPLYFSVLEQKLQGKETIPHPIHSDTLRLKSLSLEGSLHPSIHLNINRFERIMQALKGSPSMQSLEYLKLGSNALGTLPLDTNNNNALEALRDLLKQGNQLQWIHLDNNEFSKHTPKGLDAIVEIMDQLPRLQKLDLSKNTWTRAIKKAIRQRSSRSNKTPTPKIKLSRFSADGACLEAMHSEAKII